MYQLVQLNRQVRYLFIAFLLASFAMAQSAQSVGPEPSEGDLNGNMAEEETAVLDLSTNSATGQGDNTREIPININKFLQKAGGNVILKGNVLVTFEHPELGRVLVKSIKLEGFSGTAVAGHRKLEAKNLKRTPYTNFDEVKKEGKFGIEFDVTGPGLPAASPFQFHVEYSSNFYKWKEGKVTTWSPDKSPFIRRF